MRFDAGPRIKKVALRYTRRRSGLGLVAMTRCEPEVLNCRVHATPTLSLASRRVVILQTCHNQAHVWLIDTCPSTWLRGLDRRSYFTEFDKSGLTTYVELIYK